MGHAGLTLSILLPLLSTCWKYWHIVAHSLGWRFYKPFQFPIAAEQTALKCYEINGHLVLFLFFFFSPWVENSCRAGLPTGVLYTLLPENADVLIWSMQGQLDSHIWCLLRYAQKVSSNTAEKQHVSLYYCLQALRYTWNQCLLEYSKRQREGLGRHRTQTRTTSFLPYCSHKPAQIRGEDTSLTVEVK